MVKSPDIGSRLPAFPPTPSVGSAQRGRVHACPRSTVNENSSSLPHIDCYQRSMGTWGPLAGIGSRGLEDPAEACMAQDAEFAYLARPVYMEQASGKNAARRHPRRYGGKQHTRSMGRDPGSGPRGLGRGGGNSTTSEHNEWTDDRKRRWERLEWRSVRSSRAVDLSYLWAEELIAARTDLALVVDLGTRSFSERSQAPANRYVQTARGTFVTKGEAHAHTAC